MVMKPQIVTIEVPSHSEANDQNGVHHIEVRDDSEVLNQVIITPNGYVKEEIIESAVSDPELEYQIAENTSEEIEEGGESGEDGEGQQFLEVVDTLLAAAQNDDSRRRRNAEAARQQRVKQKAYIESLKQQIRELHKQVRQKEKTYQELKECIARKDSFIENQLRTCIAKLEDIDSSLAADLPESFIAVVQPQCHN